MVIVRLKKAVRLIILLENFSKFSHFLTKIAFSTENMSKTMKKFSIVPRFSIVQLPQYVPLLKKFFHISQGTQQRDFHSPPKNIYGVIIK